MVVRWVRALGKPPQWAALGCCLVLLYGQALKNLHLCDNLPQSVNARIHNLCGPSDAAEVLTMAL